MNYRLTAPQIHLTDKSNQLLQRRITLLSRHLPTRLASGSIHLSLKQNIAHNHLEGIATFHVPGRTLVVRANARTIKNLLNELIQRMHRQIIRYTTTHDRSHSKYPDKTTIRKVKLTTDIEV